MDAPRFVPEDSIREDAWSTFQKHKKEISRSIPEGDIQHVGGTSIPGALTKGDVDISVRVQADDFEAAVAALRSMYEVHQTHNWTETFASFRVDPPAHPPVGVHISVVGSTDDFFVAIRDLLCRDPDLLARYNSLKTSHADETEETYKAAKAAFIHELLAERLGIRPPGTSN